MTVAFKAGFKIVKTIERAEPELIQQFQAMLSADISDVQGRQNIMDPRVKPIYQPMPTLCGSIVTVKARPGDNLIPFKAIEVAQPGDVIVIDGAFDMNYSVWGGVMCSMAKANGVAGLVTDGLVRDVAQARELEFPIFAIGLTPAGPTKESGGQINVPISCGGAVIFPGDILVGDEDGVIVVRRDEARSVLERAKARAAEVEAKIASFNSGELLSIADTDEALRARGCEIID